MLPRAHGAFVLLAQENHKLRDQNDDLNGQILSLSLYEAKNLFATQTKAQSLAAEIDTASRDEVALSSWTLSFVSIVVCLHSVGPAPASTCWDPRGRLRPGPNSPPLTTVSMKSELSRRQHRGGA